MICYFTHHYIDFTHHYRKLFPGILINIIKVETIKIISRREVVAGTRKHEKLSRALIAWDCIQRETSKINQMFLLSLQWEWGDYYYYYHYILKQWFLILFCVIDPLSGHFDDVVIRSVLSVSRLKALNKKSDFLKLIKTGSLKSQLHEVSWKTLTRNRELLINGGWWEHTPR